MRAAQRALINAFMRSARAARFRASPRALLTINSLPAPLCRYFNIADGKIGARGFVARVALRKAAAEGGAPFEECVR